MTRVVNIAQGGSNNTTFRNKLINGVLDFWQRGTSFSPTVGVNTYTADRFAAFVSGTGGTIAVTQQAVTPTTFTALGATQDPQYFLQYQCSVLGSTTYMDLNQRIEDVRTFAGQNITVSFYAKADTTRTVGVQLYQNFGSGGSSDVGGSVTNISVTSSWARYTVTLACSSISGKTIGAGSWVAVVFVLPVSTFTLSFSLVQAEYGTTATPFENRLYGTELALCQRYYELVSWVPHTTNTFQTIYYKATKRASPTVTFIAGDSTPTVAVNGSYTPTESFYQNGNSSVVTRSTWSASAEL